MKGSSSAISTSRRSSMTSGRTRTCSRWSATRRSKPQGLLRIQQAGKWVDVMRQHVPPDKKLYTWWSYRAKDWEAADRGRRLDHIWSTPGLAPACKELEDPEGSPWLEAAVPTTCRSWRGLRCESARPQDRGTSATDRRPGAGRTDRRSHHRVSGPARQRRSRRIRDTRWPRRMNRLAVDAGCLQGLAGPRRDVAWEGRAIIATSPSMAPGPAEPIGASPRQEIRPVR